MKCNLGGEKNKGANEIWQIMDNESKISNTFLFVCHVILSLPRLLLRNYLLLFFSRRPISFAVEF